MFKWFRRLLNKPYEDTLREIERKLMPSNISEPVLSIVKTFEEKGRWRIYNQGCPLSTFTYGSGWSFSVEDTFTGEKYNLKAEWCHTSFSPLYPQGHMYFPSKLKTHSLPSWMTREEQQYVANAFNAISNRIAARMQVVSDRERTKDQKQSQIGKDKERKRLMEVYCK